MITLSVTSGFTKNAMVFYLEIEREKQREICRNISVVRFIASNDNAYLCLKFIDVFFGVNCNVGRVFLLIILF